MGSKCNKNLGSIPILLPDCRSYIRGGKLTYGPQTDFVACEEVELYCKMHGTSFELSLVPFPIWLPTLTLQTSLKISRNYCNCMADVY